MASDLEAAVLEAARIAIRQQARLEHDVEVMALYSFGGPGHAFVVWIERSDDGTWMVSGKRKALPDD